MSTTLPTSEQTVHVRHGGILLVDERAELPSRVQQKLSEDGLAVELRAVVTADELLADADASRQETERQIQTVVFSPLRWQRGTRVADVEYSRAIVQTCKQLGLRRFVLISSAEIYGASYANSGQLKEKEAALLKRSSDISRRWAEIEELATDAFEQSGVELVILRPCWTLSAKHPDLASRLFGGRLAFSALGYDPSVQVLSLDDLAGSIVAAVNSAQSGIYNVAPDEVIPLRTALRLTRTLKIPVPFTVLRWSCSARSRDQLEFIRYSWTLSNQKIKDELGFQPRQSSAQALAEFTGTEGDVRPAARIPEQETCDPFGMDKGYIRSCGRWQFGFVEQVYWRVEFDGLENIPSDGGGVLAGPHRGFMPFDGVMLVHILSKYLGRVPRFLMHPALVKFPFLATFLTRIGGLIACQENADCVVESGEMVGVFPEGIRGAFRMYDRGETYQLGKFRDDYVKIALRHGVPIIPFVTVGPAESFPILGKIDWPWWKRQTHWPFFPITATWPLLPIPLPTKWHIKFLDPIDTRVYGPEAADDRKVVTQLSREIRDAMQLEIDAMRSRRNSIFRGSIFQKSSPNRADAIKRDSVESSLGATTEAK